MDLRYATGHQSCGCAQTRLDVSPFRLDRHCTACHPKDRLHRKRARRGREKNMLRHDPMLRSIVYAMFSRLTRQQKSQKSNYRFSTSNVHNSWYNCCLRPQTSIASTRIQSPISAEPMIASISISTRISGRTRSATMPTDAGMMPRNLSPRIGVILSKSSGVGQ